MKDKNLATSAMSTIDESWRSPKTATAFVWPARVALRGSVRLFGGRVVGTDEVDRRWQKAVRQLRRDLKLPK